MKYYDYTKMTEQEVFDASVEHLLEQGVPSIEAGEYPKCVYRSEEGLQCAAGIFLAPEKEYPQDKTWGHLVFTGRVDGTHDLIIRQLQRCHDRAAHASHLRNSNYLDSLNRELREVAKINKLKFQGEQL